MTTTVDFGTGGISYPANSQAIYTRQDWLDDWAHDSTLYCTEATWSCAPNIPTATCVRQYGWNRPVGVHQWGYQAKLDSSQISRWYIKIEFTLNSATRTWYGVVGDVDDEQLGHVTELGTEYESGEQTIYCYGLEYLLDREPLAHSFAWNGQTGVLLYVDTAIAFNKGGVGNRTELRYSASGLIPMSYVFDGSAENPNHPYRTKWDDWSTKDIVEYLLNARSPGNSIFQYVPGVQFTLDPLTAIYLPDDDKPVVEQEGATVLSLLNRLIDRRRLRTYYCDILPASNTPTIYIVPLNKDQITLPDGRLIFGVTPGAETIDLQCDYDPMTTVRVRQVDNLHADHIVLRGARRTTTCTLFWHDWRHRLEEGWSLAQELDYTAGASNEAGYATWNLLKQIIRNAEARTQTNLAPVYCWFRLSDIWDGYCGYTLTNRVCFPDDNNMSVKYRDEYVHEVVFEPELALWEGIDYSDAAAITAPRAAPRDYIRREPLLIFHTQSSYTTRYVIGSEMMAGAERDVEEHGEAQKTFNCVLRIQPESHICEVHVVGAPQYAIADKMYTPLAEDRDYGKWTYNAAAMLITVTLRDNRYCEGRWPEPGAPDPTGPGNDAVRGYVIHTERDYRKDFLAQDTVVDVADDGTLVTVEAPGYIQDDSDTLKGYARLLYEWYATTRYTITLVTKQLETAGSLSLGDFIETFGSGGHALTCNTVITETTIKSPLGTGDEAVEMEQTFSTGHGEMDILALLPRSPRKA